MSKVVFNKNNTYTYNEKKPIFSGNSLVYRAVDNNLQRDVCLKIIEDIKDSKTEKFIKREVGVLCKVAEKTLAIPKIFDYYYDEKQQKCFIVMEWINGTRFDKYIYINEKDLVRKIIQLVDILIDMSKEHFYHKDIKPENIIIRNDKDVILMDFNITANIANIEEGTMNYRAPEMEGIIRTTDRSKSDMFSIGVMAYEKITNELPVNGMHYGYESNFKNSGKWDEFQEPKYKTKISNLLNNIIVRCMQAEPKDRFTSLLELKKSLERCLKNG